jgi:hypothetical protein
MRTNRMLRSCFGLVANGDVTCNRRQVQTKEGVRNGDWMCSPRYFHNFASLLGSDSNEYN